jgi:hypothetical protein
VGWEGGVKGQVDQLDQLDQKKVSFVLIELRLQEYGVARWGDIFEVFCWIFGGDDRYGWSVLLFRLSMNGRL